MSWRGTMRSMQAAARRIERDAKRRQRELEAKQKQLAKMQELERAAYEVEVFENYIEVITSIHKDCGETIDWKTMHKSSSPTEPINRHLQEKGAQTKLDNFKPNFFMNLLRRAEREQEKLKLAIEEAKQADQQEYEKNLRAYEQELKEWKASHDLAERVLAHNTKAYIEAFTEMNPLAEISGLGSSVGIQIDGDNPSVMEVALQVNSEQVIPKEQKSLLKSGKLSIKNMTKTRFYELYQDYVCGAVLRVAREVFSLLPIEMVIVTAMGELLNTQTGHLEDSPILSVAIPKKSIEKLKFELLDPSDSMANFVHNMKFRKTQGFAPVEKIILSELQSSE